VTQPNIASPRRTATLEIGGQDVVLAYADERAEYDALRTGAVVVDRAIGDGCACSERNPERR